MSYEDPWEAFGEGNRPNVVCDFTGSLAADVCEDFGLECATPSIGGTLNGIDIKQMDAITVIRLSLLEEAANSRVLYEPIVNNRGEVEFKKIGQDNPSLDIYYTIQTHTYKEECKGVMVTGKKPMAYRKAMEWTDLLTEEYGVYVHDTSALTSNCNEQDFKHSSTITYHDPHLSTAYKDGIDNLYEINENNPWDRVLGYAYKILPPSYIKNREDISISMDNTCEVPHIMDYLPSEGQWEGFPIPDIGELAPNSNYTAEDLACWVDRGVEIKGGIELQIPEELRYETTRGVRVDKLLGVNMVYVIGIECNTCKGIPINDAAAGVGTNTDEFTDLWVAIDSLEPKTHRLDAGVHYIINFEGEATSRKVKLKFANNARFKDNAKFGTNVKFKVLPNCKYFRQGGVTSGQATILPTGGTKGILVTQVVAVLSVESPCVRIVDPLGDADQIANDLEIQIAPLVLIEEPPPIAKNGSIINQVDGIMDHDPTTTQNFEESELNKAIKSMDGGPGLTMALSFLDENGVRNLSEALYDYMSSGDGAETTYVCGPDTQVELGDRGDAGGVINSISYSYSDQGSYTISVNEGPYIVGGVEGISGGAYIKQTESFSSEGIVIQDGGNHVDYMVRVDDFGDVYAINCTPSIIRVGDRVSVSLKNNPVEG